MLSDEWLPRYRLLKNFTMKWNGNGNGNAHGNGNAYDRGDYNSSFALRAVELKTDCLAFPTNSHILVRLKKIFWPVLESFFFLLRMFGISIQYFFEHFGPFSYGVLHESTRNRLDACFQSVQTFS